MEYEHTRQKHLGHFASILPEQLERLRWNAEQLRHERERRLRELLRVALARSPWHQRRLRGVQPDRFREEDLDRLPPMSKVDLMENWNEIVTDPRLTLDRAREHIAHLTSDAYLLDEFHAVASGGSSGHRGVFVFGWESWALAAVGLTRTMLWDLSLTPELARGPATCAVVAAHHASHMTSALAETFAMPQLQKTVRLPVTLPMAEIVSGLNECQPTALVGYASALALLAAEARAGRLSIAPQRVISTAEPLPLHVRRAVEQVWGAPVASTWGTSEAGAMANGCFRAPGMHLCDDLVIIEPVDQSGARVAADTRSDKIFLTGIANPTLPLIRYEISDQMLFMSERCPCGSAHQRIADVEGRLDDVFTYADGVTIHPHVFRTALLAEAGLVEYQVRQTSRGADIRAIGTLAAPAATARALETNLRRLGVTDAAIEIRIVDQLERLPTGKARRFVPLDVGSAL